MQQFGTAGAEGVKPYTLTHSLPPICALTFESLDLIQFVGMREYLQNIYVKFVHQGHRVKTKFKVTASKRHYVTVTKSTHTLVVRLRLKGNLDSHCEC